MTADFQWTTAFSYPQFVHRQEGGAHGSELAIICDFEDATRCNRPRPGVQASPCA